jgi:2-polyprenyl-6-methoxyphenol hydroxylase-like FAD-dependent oxidoreductase
MAELNEKTDKKLFTRCCIAGGGPAGMMLGFLLARAGVDVIVLEKHADFLRDFRGDTIHPSTLEIMHELGLLDEFLKLPHERVYELSAQIGTAQLKLAEFRNLPVRCPFIAFMPQWDFLNFLADSARRYPTFRLLMEAEVTELVNASAPAAAVRVKTAKGTIDVTADLVVGADGRNSIIREKAGLAVQEIGAPMDVLWFRLPRKPGDPAQTMGRFDTGRIFININRGEHWQCGYVIAKGQFQEIRGQGLALFREKIAELAPYAKGRMDELKSWDDVKLLTVRVDRLSQWFRPGLLCIGDAAHAMSPIGGVGINLAVQDAVAAANVLAQPLSEGRITVKALAQIQKRREFPTRVTQWLQVGMQRRVIARVLHQTGPVKPPLLLRLIAAIPLLRRIPARIIGLGIRPEHVKVPERHESTGGVQRPPSR